MLISINTCRGRIDAAGGQGRRGGGRRVAPADEALSNAVWLAMSARDMAALTRRDVEAYAGRTR